MNLASFVSQFISGLSITLILMLVSASFGLILAIMMTAGLFSGNFLLKNSVRFVIFFICGTPLLVQIFLIYYGAGQFAWIRESYLWIILREPMTCAIIAFSINSACYTSVILSGAIKSVPRNEIDACKAIGMSKWLAFRRIILPRAFRIAMPAYSNEVIMLLKSTSLASTITILDLMGVTQALIAQTYLTVELYVVVGVIYLMLNAVIMSIFRLLRRVSELPSQ